MILSSVYAFYATLLRARTQGGQIARDAMLTRALLEQIAEEIRHATDIVPGDGIGFRGEKDHITIVRTRMPELYAFAEFDPVRDEPPPAQMDLLRVRYELLWDEELEDEEGNPVCHGLWRSVQKTFDPNPKFIVKDEAEPGDGGDENDEEDEDNRFNAPQIEGELIAPEIKYVRFEYFDGADWRKQWQVVGEEGGVDMGPTAATGQGTYALPQAVKITLGQVPVPPEEDRDLLELEEEEEEDEEYHPDRFTLVVHLLQADPSLASSRKYGVVDAQGREQGVP